MSYTTVTNRLKKQSLIYINFAPYTNAGRILDWLIENFAVLVVFSFDFHNLNTKAESNVIQIFERGKRVKTIHLFKLPTPESLLFLTLPLIMGLIALQTVWHIGRFVRRYGQFDLYLTVNAFTAWLGNLLRGLRLVRKTIFWVWDYYPPGYPDWRIRLARWAYWRLDQYSSIQSTAVVFLNQRLMTLRQSIGVLPRDRQYRVVPIGTNPGRIRVGREIVIGHLGVLKQSQGLDLLFDHLPALRKLWPNLRVEIIGSGPDRAHFEQRAKGLKYVKFYGYIKDEGKVDLLIRDWTLGIATYIPETTNPAYWTDPSKMKLYISQGVPIITTSISPFAEIIDTARAGIVIDYYQPRSFIEAVNKIINSNADYKHRALTLAKRYHYKTLYWLLFED